MSLVFFPQPLLDHCIVEGLVDLKPGELVLIPFSRSYAVADHVRIVEELAGQPDPHGFIGKVKAKKELEEIGAEILEDSMLIGENAYAVVPGFAGTSSAPLADFGSEDELLLAFLAKVTA